MLNSKIENQIYLTPEKKLSLLKREFKKELKNLLEYWSTVSVDEKNGGYLGHIDNFGNKNYESSKGAVLNTRILWTFSSAFRTTKNPKYKAIAKKQFRFIIDNFWDTENGGLFWELDYQLNPINTRKQAYAQGFGIYAFSEFYRITKDEESLKYCKELYTILEEKFADKTYGGYIEALTKDWQTIEDMRLSDKDLNCPKSMNTHLHILEPYTNLYRIWKSKKLKKNITDLILIFQNKIIDKKTGNFSLFFDMDWSKKSSIISFGHDIEGAWLLHEASQVVQNEILVKSVQETALKLVDITLQKGIASDGSVYNEQNGNHIDKDKHWWVQAEAMVGLMDAYQIKPKQQYLTAVYRIWEFIKNHIIDKKHGEWFWRVDEHGVVIMEENKLGFWKCPYHNSRALMELIERIEKIK